MTLTFSNINLKNYLHYALEPGGKPYLSPEYSLIALMFITQKVINQISRNNLKGKSHQESSRSNQS